MSVQQPPAPAQPAIAWVLDACILMSGVLRPALLELAARGWFRPLWSERIGQEWRRNAARLWPVTPATLMSEWQVMQARFPEADPGDVTPYLAGLRESDAKDWHVIAAALAARARNGQAMRVGVLTWNLKDFRRAELRRLGVDLIDPDRLLLQWWRAAPNAITALLEQTLVDLADAGRPRQGDILEVLRRERLFRLVKQMNATRAAASPAEGGTPLVARSASSAAIAFDAPQPSSERVSVSSLQTS